ncbi:MULTISPECIES: LysR family transcriptional regulator [unclassified Rhizobium]|uniref:LysR family transcriptional regulator n=1 Tax=unclassified Rhizobium TaxID=2613769 RepID=UPI0021671CF2|nr:MULTISPECIES: LysR family transcriptional regulator [unclassified Rhizobium]MCS3740113.1 DNA-binding transcriptional LysR family regulator [Rhizobium sp. BK661]MCS4091937.1 DNA-binding transcriptional LysR family regulator [Rhizobium sp. BK176]
MQDMLADRLPAGNDYNQMRAFIAVAEYLSFSRAAEVLGVSPSALSQMIRSFEKRVGMRLLHRTTRNVSLTEGGENLFRRVRPAAFELGDALAQTRIAGERPAGTVRVHAFRSAAQKHIQPILKSFAERYPDIVLDITIDDETVDIVAGGYDVAVRIGEVIERDMVAVRLGPELRQLAVATPDYFSQHGRPEHPRDLVHHRCVRWRWPGHQAPYAWEFFENDAWFSVAVNGPLILSDKETALNAALQGVGIGFAVEDTVADYIGQGRLVSCLEAWSAPFPGWFVCYPQQRQMAPALRAFIDAVRSGPDAGLSGEAKVVV